MGRWRCCITRGSRDSLEGARRRRSKRREKRSALGLDDAFEDAGIAVFAAALDHGPERLEDFGDVGVQRCDDHIATECQGAAGAPLDIESLIATSLAR